MLSSVTLRQNNSQTSTRGFPDGSDGKESACSVGDLGLIPGLGISSGEESGNPLQYSCLENSMDREAWRAIVHRVAKSWTRLSDFTHTHTNIKEKGVLFS